MTKAPTHTEHSASGKIILLGEHAVVYGVEAIAAGLTRGAVARAVPATTASLRLGTRSAVPGDGSLEGDAFSKVLDFAGARPLAVDVQLDLPLGVGLGSSAAAGVAVARAVLATTETPPTDELVFQAAVAWENVFHGNASGIDVAAACYGGCFTFQRGAAPRRLAPGGTFEFGVAVAGPAASTREMVEQVAGFRRKDQAAFERALESIATLARNAEQAILHGDLPTLGKLLDLNQMLLSAWFVSTPEIEGACRLARENGALGAKLTGAGGGGAVVALAAPGALPQMLSAWQGAGLTCFSTQIAPENVGTHPPFTAKNC